MNWTRRSVLRALGTSSIVPFLAPALNASCASGGSNRRWERSLGRIDRDEVRAALRAVVADLSSRFGQATALATFRRVGRVVADADAHTLESGTDAAIVLRIAHSATARSFESMTRDTSVEGIAQAHASLRERAAAGYQSSDPGRPLSEPRDFASNMAVDPATTPQNAWIPQIDDLYQQSQHIGGSRVVYRGAYLMTDDVTEIFVGDGSDLAQRLVRARAGVVLIAQRGQRSETVPIVDIAEKSGLMGLEASTISRRAIEAAADRVNALSSPTAPPTGLMDLVLDPSCAALIAHRCVGPALAADLWVRGQSLAARLAGQRVASELVTVIDDPSVPGAYGSYFFDHEGRAPGPTRLLESGVLARPLTDGESARLLGMEPAANGRRQPSGARLAPAPSNLAFAPGTSTRAQLVGAVDRGLLLEGAVFADADPRTWTFTLRAGRAHEIRSGRTTGVLFSDIDVRGRIPDLLAAVRGVSSDMARTPAPTTLASTMGGPHLLTRAEVV